MMSSQRDIQFLYPLDASLKQHYLELINTSLNQLLDETIQITQEKGVLAITLLSQRNQTHTHLAIFEKYQLPLDVHFNINFLLDGQQKSLSQYIFKTDLKINTLQLKTELQSAYSDKRLIHPIFMPRNEEEIMRNILILGSQIKYLHDLPQLIIMFDEQTNQELIFTLIIVTVIKPPKKPLLEALQHLPFAYKLERKKTLGLMRKKYPKEASVFRCKLPKERFIRNDQSIDLPRARLQIIQELKALLGPIRDYNGGMLSKQNELLDQLKQQLGEQITPELPIDSFFYSLKPDFIRPFIHVEILKSLYLMLSQKNTINTAIDQYAAYFALKIDDAVLKEKIEFTINQQQYAANKLITASLSIENRTYLAFALLSNDEHEKNSFNTTLKEESSQLVSVEKQKILAP